MTIASRDQVRAAVDRALQLDAKRDLDVAVASVAQAMGLSVDGDCHGNSLWPD